MTFLHELVQVGKPVVLQDATNTGQHAAVDASGNVMVKSAAGTEIASLTRMALAANVVTGQTAAITGTTATSVIAAVTGKSIFLTSLLVTNDHATVGTVVTIQDNADTPKVLFKGYAVSLGGGFAISFPVPPFTGAGKALMAICATTGSSIYVSAVGYSEA